jgi:hypothetical protein
VCCGITHRSSPLSWLFAKLATKKLITTFANNHSREKIMQGAKSRSKLH